MNGEPNRTVRELRPADAVALAELFGRLAADPETHRFFHPHPLDEANAKRIAGYRGQDVYLGCFEGDRAVGYAILRGWDEGYEAPALGVATDPGRRRSGVATVLMEVLLKTAAARGARQVMLHVHPEHALARRWYEAVGFTADRSGSAGQLVYRLSIRKGRQPGP